MKNPEVVFKLRRRVSPPSCALVAMIAASLPSTASAQEAHAYGIEDYGGPGECGSGAPHPWHISSAVGFQLAFVNMAIYGRWTSSVARNNANARGSYFTDATKVNACGCVADDVATDFGVDEADVAFIHTHGSHTAANGEYYTSLTMGNSSYDCSARTDQNMQFGNTGADLEIVIVKACQSADYDVWRNAGYRQQITTSTSSLSMWNGFHGNSSCGNPPVTYVTDYAASSEYNGAGENWIDAAYDWDPSIDDDDCPASIVMGATTALRDSMHEYGGWNDRKDTGSKTASSYYFVNGCDPAAGVVLP